ncbi:MAG TPA: hypothetical protein VJN18_13690 [Polyangiaceae bacterium]|nr:hypothetical protein [Polyangiaceae bacterium]
MIARRIERRTVLRAAALGLPTLVALSPQPAAATLVRGLKLQELVSFSDWVVVLTPVTAFSHWETLGGQRMIVTDTRATVDDSIHGRARESEVIVRVPGGRVGDTGELVAGQAELSPGQAGVTFLKRASDGVYWATGMGQGHYPLTSAQRGPRFLRANRSLPTLLRWEGSAVQRLPGTELAEARRLILRARSR